VADSVISRLKSAWNVFVGKKNGADISEDLNPMSYHYGMISSSVRPDRPRLTRGNEQSITNSIYNRIAMDVSALTINHVRLDESYRFKEVIDSGLNRCFTLSANIDQTGRAFIHDAVLSMLDEGSVALVPVETSENMNTSSSFDIYSIRAGKITEWFPDRVRVDLYDDRVGRHKEITVLKRNCAIIENPMYSVMNEPNSTLRRLIRKLNILDVIDEQTASGKFNMIVQLPYAVRSPKRQEEAAARQKTLEAQLNGSKYGVAYIDAAEKVTQLNRPLENNLLTQIEYLTKMLYGQIGITQAVMDGTADEQETLNYTNRAIEPIISAICDECKRKFLTKTAITQKQSIMFFRDPFKLVPVNNIAEIVDKFTRNEVMTKNEFRQVIGMKPSDDPRADELRNSNISESKDAIEAVPTPGETPTQQAEQTGAERFIESHLKETIGKGGIGQNG